MCIRNTLKYKNRAILLRDAWQKALTAIILNLRFFTAVKSRRLGLLFEKRKNAKRNFHFPHMKNNKKLLPLIFQYCLVLRVCELINKGLFALSAGMIRAYFCFHSLQISIADVSVNIKRELRRPTHSLFSFHTSSLSNVRLNFTGGSLSKDAL